MINQFKELIENEVLDVLEDISYAQAFKVVLKLKNKFPTAFLKDLVLEFLEQRDLDNKTFDLYVKDLNRILECNEFHHQTQNAKTVIKYIYFAIVKSAIDFRIIPPAEIERIVKETSNLTKLEKIQEKIEILENMDLETYKTAKQKNFVNNIYLELLEHEAKINHLFNKLVNILYEKEGNNG